MIIGKGTNPNLNSHATINLDKAVLSDLDRNRPEGGYPPAQERAIEEMRKRAEAYVAEFGEVKQ